MGTKKEKMQLVAKDLAKNTKNIIGNIANKTKDKLENMNSMIDEKFDVNNDGKVDIIDIIYLAIKIPGIAVDREEFFKNIFKKYYSYDIIYNAIESNPKMAGIDNVTIEKIADEVIEFERKCATGASAALGLPGGLALVATLPTDIIQYFAFLIRAAQKLMYLYGFSSIGLTDGNEKINEDTMNTLIGCLGVMFGVQGADAALHTIVLVWLKGTEKAMASFSIKAIIPSLGKIVTGLLAKGGLKVLPLLGGVVSGGLTYATFKPCCERLRKSLRSICRSEIENIKK